MTPDPSLYTVSSTEMARRMRAYATLVISLFTGAAVSSFDRLLAAPGITVAALLGLAVALGLSWLLFLAYFRRYSDTLVRLDDSALERTRGETTETWRLEDVAGVRVKRTTRGGIRELTLRLRDGRRVSLSGIEDYERLARELRDRVPERAAWSEVREPIDYDHPLFYVVFGTLVGLALTFSVRALLAMDARGLRWTSFGIGCYAAIVGAFFLVARPVAERYGPRSRVADFILGALGLLAGAVIAVRALAG
jgi:hypothetical protein